MKRIITAIIICVFALAANAQVVFKSQIDRSTVYKDGKFTIQYTLENARSASNFTEPEIAGCEILYVAGPTTYSSYSNINGHVSQSQGIQYTITVLATKTGTVTIPPATVESDGKKYTSNSHKIKVTDAPANPYGGRGGYGGYSGYGGHTPAPPTQTVDDKPLTHSDVFVRMTLSRNSAYEQQAIVCDIQLYSTAQATNLSYNTTPKIDGFLIEDASPRGNITSHTVTEGGKTFYVYPLRKYILYPQKTGKLSINSGEYEIELIHLNTVRSGFYTYTIPSQETFTTRAVTKDVEIKALPTPKPAGFSGAVGTYQAEATVEPLSLKTNELGTLTYTITGTGNINYLAAPEPAFPSTFEFDQNPRSESDVKVNNAGNDVTGRVEFIYEFVPENVGTFTVEPHDFIFFDPSKGEYVTIDLPVFDIQVAKGKDTSVSANELLSHREMKDILPNADSSRDNHYDARPMITQMWYWCIWIALVVVLGIVVIVRQKQDKLKSDVTRLKMSRANKIARKRFKKAAKYMQRHENNEFYTELLKALWGYVGDKLNIPPSQLTRDNVSEKLSAYGMTEEEIAGYVSLLDDLEMARYTPDAPGLTTTDLYDHATDVVKTMESVKHAKNQAAAGKEDEDE